jgi:hypothetical protein
VEAGLGGKSGQRRDRLDTRLLVIVPARTRAIVEDRAFRHGALEPTLHGLMMRSDGRTATKTAGRPTDQQDPRPFDPARRLVRN